MNIASWNVCFLNPDFDEAFRFISSLEADLICLQEVPEVLLAKLRTLPYAMATAIDVDRLFDTGLERNYLVILSKYAIERSGAIPLSLPYLPLRTRLFVRLMKRKGWSKIANRHALWADITIAAKTVRIVNVHLLLAYPAVRAAEFECALSGAAGTERIVCGDFNILEHPKATLLNWILGGTCSDFIRIKRERNDMESRFAEKKLQNPLRGTTAHNFASGQQLSHILVPLSARIKKAKVDDDWHGSDHRPVFVELE